MASCKIVLRNTLFSYGRTLISAVLTLFSSRWVLADLGASDYGIYGLAGGFLLFVSFISSILSQGTGRYLAYATGSGSSKEVTKWFNAALNIFFCLPLILIPIGLVAGEVIIRFVLKIDPIRINAALWVFRCSILSFFFVLIATPFLSLLMSKQKIHIAASLSLFHSIGLFIIAWILPYMRGDHLIVYALMVAISFVFLQILYVVVCKYICAEATINFSYWWNKDRLRALITYSGWLSVGTIGTVVNIQGQGILLNLMKGTSANAGANVASSLSGQMQTLANAFLQAVSPEVIRREGANDRTGMVLLAKQASKLGMFFIMLVALPVFCECEYILKLWLKNVPPYASFFARITILSSLFYKMAVGHRMCFQAVGKIRSQQIVELLVFSITVPVIGIAYLFTKSVYIAFSFVPLMQFVYFVLTVIVGSRLFEWRVLDAILGISLKCSIGFVLCLSSFQIVPLIMKESFYRLLITGFLMFLLLSIYFFVFIFSPSERQFPISFLRKLIYKRT